MKRFLLAALIAPLLMCAGCNDDNGGGSNKSYPAVIPSTDRFPVVAWHGVRSSFASVERFKEAEDMGITLNYSRMSNVENALRMLDLAAQTNVKLIVEVDELYKTSEIDDAVKALMNHSALAGYFMDDEPQHTQFAGIGERMKQIQRIDNKHICYCNLFPSFGPNTSEALDVRNYRDYVLRYLNACPATFLSFDQYPIVQNVNETAIKAEWYEALEVASDEARKHNIDLWTFLLTVPHTSYPQPTLDHLRLQGYSNLAYGSQALQCFTYWTPTVENPTTWNYRNAPIEEDGTRSATYDIVKNYLNEVQTLAWIFRGCTAEGVWHLAPGGRIPDTTQPLTTMPEMAEDISVATGETALVSVLKNHGYTFLVVQNTSVTSNANAVIKVKEGVRFVNHDGTITLASAQGASQVITPGDIRIYMW